ncbi:hypothetical protein B0H21DRAFT_820271 [Amylocystis lapponica]|nr:hypothetical protein B0H21DRAFT_820271 [Amylocystis lapponica]
MSAPITKFAVYLPDAADAHERKLRLLVLDEHYKRANALIRDGTYEGGVMLSPESATAPEAERKLVGTIIFVEAPTLEAARKIIEEDVYWTVGVWDKEKMTILPFLPVTAPPETKIISAL